MINNSVAFAISVALGTFLFSAGAARAQVFPGVDKPPEIAIDSVPDFGVSGFLKGHVRHADPARHSCVTYILVQGLGWFSKPYAAQPLVGIANDGTLVVDVDTGGIDAWATHYFVALVKAGSSPPVALGAPSLPSSPLFLATDIHVRFERIIEWEGYSWGVKSAPLPVGPGQNRFTSDPRKVYVDGAGQLHLTISYESGQWWCTEVVLLSKLGYGTYEFVTTHDLSALPPSGVFGAFSWDDRGTGDPITNNVNCELDFEDSLWNAATPTPNSQIVVQPWNVAGNLVKYAIAPSAGNTLTRSVTWREDRVEFRTVAGNALIADAEPLPEIFKHSYEHAPALGHFVPSAAEAQWRFNLWLFNGVPAPGTTVEVVVSDFRYSPLRG